MLKVANASTLLINALHPRKLDAKTTHSNPR